MDDEVVRNWMSLMSGVCDILVCVVVVIVVVCVVKVV